LVIEAIVQDEASIVALDFGGAARVLNKKYQPYHKYWKS